MVITEHADINEDWYQSSIVEKWRGGAALVPAGQIMGNVEDLHVRTDQIVLLYANDERPAVDAARTLASFGFPHLRVLGGGLKAWKEAGLPVEQR